MQPLQVCIYPIIRIGRESWCLPYAGFFILQIESVPSHSKLQVSGSEYNEWTNTNVKLPTPRERGRAWKEINIIGISNLYQFVAWLVMEVHKRFTWSQYIFGFKRGPYFLSPGWPVLKLVIRQCLGVKGLRVEIVSFVLFINCSFY